MVNLQLSDMSVHENILVVSDDSYYLHAFLHQGKMSALLINANNEKHVLEVLLSKKNIDVLVVKHTSCYFVYNILKLLRLTRWDLWVIIDSGVRMEQKFISLKDITFIGKHIPFFELLVFLRERKLKKDTEDDLHRIFSLCRTWRHESTRLREGNFENRFTKKNIQKRVSVLKISVAQAIGISRFNMLVFYRFLIMLKGAL